MPVISIPISFSSNETPAGLQNSVNTIFSLLHGIVEPGSLILVLNGLNLNIGLDYNLSGVTNQTITFTFAPKSTDIIRAWYVYGSEIINAWWTTLPTGIKNGVNTTFNVPSGPETPLSGTLRLFYNGVLLNPGTDFTVSSSTIIMSFAPNSSDTLLAMYRSFDPDIVASANTEYHDPIFLDAQHYEDPISKIITTYFDFYNVSGDQFYYKINAYDYDGNTINYSLQNTENFPGTISIDIDTGWISGTINRNEANLPIYQLGVQIYKLYDPSYQSTAIINMFVENPLNQSLIWNSPTFIGNVTPGVPSTLSVSANVIQPFLAPVINTALANCSMQVISANIISGGSNFSLGNYLNIQGGIFSNAANLVVNGIASEGGISNISITSEGPQNYIELPPSLIVQWLNPNENENPTYNAIVSLNFGVENINVIDGGGFYDTATIGISHENEIESASAIAIINNGVIQNIPVSKTGYGYQAIPQIVIHGRSQITPTNPIRYSLVCGSMPAGLQLLSNGLIAGLPTSQYFTLDEETIFDNNITNFDKTYNFTVLAEIGINNLVSYNDYDNANSTTKNYEDFQTLVQIEKDFQLCLDSSAYIASPKTNLSLEFLLSPQDSETLFSPLYDESIVSHESIFREGDFYFGIAHATRMLLTYGIAASTPAEVVNSLSNYFQDKSFLFTPPKWAQSTSEGYEVIYIQPIDRFTTENGSTFSGDLISNNLSSETIRYSQYLSNIQTVPSNSNSLYNLFPATTPNMIEQLNATLSSFDDSFLPSWMTDPQPNGLSLGYVPSIPLVYVKPGEGQRILFYLQQAYNNGLGLNSINAITDRVIWNYGYQENWSVTPSVSITGNNSGNISANSSFTVNTAIPITYAVDLTPLTFTYSGNIIVSFANTSNISLAISIINADNIVGISAGYSANNDIEITNTFGAPFVLYDGPGTPLQNIGILPIGTFTANVSNITLPNWIPDEITTFDQENIGNAIITESSIDIVTEYGDPIYTEGLSSTSFCDIPTFFEISDTFLSEDEGSVYIKFPNSTFLNQQVVSV